MKPETSAIKVSIIQTANPIKEKVHFFYYRLAKGISGILSYAKEGVRLWFRIKRPTYHQLCLKLLVWIDKRICLPKSGSRGAYLSVSIYRIATLNASDKSKLGTMGRYTRLLLQFTETQEVGTRIWIIRLGTEKVKGCLILLISPRLCPPCISKITPLILRTFSLNFFVFYSHIIDYCIYFSK